MWIHCYTEGNPHFEENEPILGKFKECGSISILEWIHILENPELEQCSRSSRAPLGASVTYVS